MRIKFIGTISESEKAFQIFDTLSRKYFNCYGIKRINSCFDRYGDKLQEIKADIPGLYYDLFRELALHELCKATGKKIDVSVYYIGQEKSVVIIIE